MPYSTAMFELFGVYRKARVLSGPDIEPMARSGFLEAPPDHLCIHAYNYIDIDRYRERERKRKRESKKKRGIECSRCA